MQRLLPATALALAVGLAAVPAAAQTGSGGTSGGGGAATGGGAASSGGGGASTVAPPPPGTAPPRRSAPPTTAPGAPPEADRSPATGGSPSVRSGQGGDRFLGASPSDERSPLSDRSDDGIRSGGGRLRAELQRCVDKHRGLDHDSDGELAAAELDSIKRLVKDVDRNHDEKLDSSELRSACASGLLTDRELPRQSKNDEEPKESKKEDK
jgi:hypothetical protein